MIARKSKQAGAFTLVELLVVISIIALLLSVLMPALQKARESGRAVVCGVNVKQQGLALSAYTIDNRGALPQADLTSYNQFIEKYMGKDKNYKSNVQGNEFKDISKFVRCPSHVLKANKRFSFWSYGLNYMNVFSEPNSGWGSQFGDSSYNYSRKLDRVPRTSMVIADASSYWIYSPNYWILDRDTDKDKDPDTNGNLLAFKMSFGPDAWTEVRYNAFASRHAKAGNVLFADISVRKITLKEWLKNKDLVWGAQNNGRVPRP